MTPEAQRIAIAEACPKVFNIVLTTYRGQRIYWRLIDGCDGLEVDPLNDLNAMHEAEKVLTQEQLGEYWFTLALTVNGLTRKQFDPENEYSCADMARATAAQRAEAFLRTLNLWQ